MLLLLIITAVSLTDIRVSPFSDTTVKFTFLYPEIPGHIEIEMKIIELTNKERTKRNLPPLSTDPHLVIASRQHSYEMIRNGYFSHISPIYYNRTPAIRIYNSGLVQYKTGENIAQNKGTLVPIIIGENPDSLAKIIVHNWMKSAHHRDNILDPGYTNIGVGAIYKDTILKVTQNFVAKPIGIDSIIVSKMNNKYLMDLYLEVYTSGISVFKDASIIEKDSLEFYYKRIRIPLVINSGSHKIELCKDGNGIYKCMGRVYIQTDNPLNSLFQPLTEFNE